MPWQILGVVVVLQYWAFWWGTTLIYCGIGNIDEGAGLKAVAIGFTLLTAAVITIPNLAVEAHRVAFPLPIPLATMVPGIWIGLRSWGALKPLSKEKGAKAV